MASMTSHFCSNDDVAASKMFKQISLKKISTYNEKFPEIRLIGLGAESIKNITIIIKGHCGLCYKQDYNHNPWLLEVQISITEV